MVYNLRSHRRDNSSSALSFTSSTASATGASFASSDDPAGYSSMLVSMKKIFESVYKCDSAAVIDATSRCGSVASQALYQGVEVILKTTTCNNAGSNLKDSVKDSVASKPFFEYQCFCDDDDFVVQDGWNCNPSDAVQKSQHVRSPSSASTGSGEDRNERNPSQASLTGTEAKNNDNGGTTTNTDDDDVRNKASGEPEEDCEKAVTALRSKWTAHTKNFYSKINSPTPRVVTTLSDVTTSSSIYSRQRPLPVETLSTAQDDKKPKDAHDESSSSSSSSPEQEWVPREMVSECREE